MARYVLLYKGVTLNEGDAEHVFFNTPASYINYLNNYYGTPTQLDISSYSINNNVFKCGRVTEEWQKITYLLEVEKIGQYYTYFKAYKVVNTKFISDMVVMTLAVDLWATFIPYADVSHIHVTRCNRDLGGGIYDDVPDTDGEVQQASFYDTINANSIAAVFRLEYNAYSKVSGSDTISSVGLFYLKLSDIRDAVKAVNPTAVETVPLIDQVADVLGGIYATGASFSTNTAHVTGCWILPDFAAKQGTISLASLSSKSLMTLPNTVTFSPVYGARAGVFTQTIKISNRLSYFDYLPQNKLFFGSYYNGLPLQRSVDNDEVYIRYTIGTDYVKVEAVQGANSQDITNSFQLPVTTSNETRSELKQISGVLGDMLGTFKQQLSGFARGGTAGGALATAGAVSSSLKELSKTDGIIAATGKGDARTTYWQTGDTNLLHPYYFLGIVNSVRDEKLHAYLDGVKYDLYADDLGFYGIQEKDHLGADASGAYTTDTYIAADCDVEGVPQNAKDYIANELKRGIYYKNIELPTNL